MFMSDYNALPMARAVTVHEPAPRTQALGKAIRRLRRYLDLTLEDLALSAGISRSFLSQIERAHAYPSIATLEGIARALGVTPQSFFEPVVEPVFIERRHVRAPTESDSASTTSMRPADPAGPRKVESFIARLPAGRRDVSDLLPRAGEWVAHVLSGELRIAVAGQWAVLDAGKTLHYTVKADGLPPSLETMVLFVDVSAGGRPPKGPGVDEA